MKKTLLILPLFAIFLITGLQAQIVLQEDFSSGTFPPQGWSIPSHAANWSAVNTANAGGESPEARFSWSPQFNGQSHLITPVLDLSDNQTGELAISFKHAIDHYGGSFEVGLAIRKTGETWSPIWTQEVSSNVNPGQKSLVISANDYPEVNGSQTEIAIYFSGNSFNINYWYIDDFFVAAPLGFDLALTEVTVPDYFYEATPVSGVVTSYGTEEIESFDVSWQIDEGEVYIESFTGLELGFNQSFDFLTETLLDLEPGGYQLKVEIVNINGEEEDDDPGNNLFQKDVYVPHDLVQRKPLFESFTSSTCPPCASFNHGFFNDFISQNINELAIIKYQMNWPGSGDPYYTPEGGVRRNYYGVSVVPFLVMEGKPLSTSATAVTNAFNQALENPAFIELGGTFVVEDQTLELDVDIMPYIDAEQFKLHAAVVEKTTTGNVGSNGESEFHYVMMKLIPNASGTTIDLTALETYHTTLSTDLSDTHIEDFEDLAVVLFLQHDPTQQIFQSAFAIDFHSIHTIDFNPAHMEENVSLDGVVNASFSMGVSFEDGTEITSDNAHEIVSYSKSTKETYTVPFSATISEDKSEITITPEENLDFTTEYTVSIDPVLWESGYVSEPVNITFTTRESAGAPVIQFNPEHESENVPVETLLTVELNQHVRFADGTEISDENAHQLISLHEYDIDGEVVSFSASINPEKTIITVTPDGHLLHQQQYLFGVDELLGRDDELSEPAHVIFTTAGSLWAGSIHPEDIKVYPNPAQKTVFVEAPLLEKHGQTRVFDLMGNIVLHKKTAGGKIRIDVQHLSPGIYIFEIQSNGFIEKRKINITN